jgi:hypothetical protein
MDQYFGKHINTPEVIEGSDKGTNYPAVNSNPVVDKSIADTIFASRPMGEPVAQDSLKEEAIGDETSVNEIHYRNLEEEIADESQNKVISNDGQMIDTVTHQAPVGANAGSLSALALFSHEESESFRIRWNEIQAKFVDEPRSSVQQADLLVSEVVEKITQTFTRERNLLESQWNQGNDVTTEDLRKVLQHYRTFFNHLVV